MTRGLCTLAGAGATDTRGVCQVDGSNSCGRDAKCDGAGGCRLAPDTTVCQAQSCSADVLSNTRACDGFGNCRQAVPPTTLCSPYACNGASCFGSCSGNTQCAAGYSCVNNVCKVSAGQQCSLNTQCVTGNCVDGVCCNTACSGVCEGACNGTCATRGADGACAGQCTGECQGRCAVRGQASCSGECRGGCSVAYREPRCSGRVVPPRVSAQCRASCDARLNAQATCTPARASVRVVGTVSSDLQARMTRLRAAVEGGYGSVLDVSARIQRVASTGEALVSNARELPGAVGSLAAGAAICAGTAVSGAVAAVASVSVSVNVSVQVSGSLSATSG